MNALLSPTRRKWVEIIERQRASGMSVAAFCRRDSIPASALYAWRRRRLRGADAPPAFVEAKIAEARSPAGVIQVRLRGGRRLMVRPGFDRALLAEVVAALEGMA